MNNSPDLAPSSGSISSRVEDLHSRRVGVAAEHAAWLILVAFSLALLVASLPASSLWLHSPSQQSADVHPTDGGL